MAKYEYVSQVRHIFESLGTIVVRSAVCAISFLGYSAPLVQFHPTNSPNSLPFETTSEVFCSAFNKSLSDTGTAYSANVSPYVDRCQYLYNVEKCIGDDPYWAHIFNTELTKTPKNSLKATSPSKKASWYESVVGESLLCRQEVDVFYTQQWPMDGLRWPRWQGGKERKGPQEINHPKAPPVDWKEGGPPLWHGQVVVYPALRNEMKASFLWGKHCCVRPTAPPPLKLALLRSCSAFFGLVCQFMSCLGLIWVTLEQARGRLYSSAQK